MITLDKCSLDLLDLLFRVWLESLVNTFILSGATSMYNKYELIKYLYYF